MTDGDENDADADDRQAVGEIEDQDDAAQRKTEEKWLPKAQRQQGMNGEAAEREKSQPQECRTLYLELAQEHGEQAELEQYQQIRLDSDLSPRQRFAT